MRTIKFRGKRIDNGEWIYGDLCQLFSKENLCIMPDSFFATRHFGEDEDGEQKIEDSLAIGGFYPVSPPTIGQSIGLHDKNGKEIYEGDILKTEQGIASVIWSDAAFAFLSSGSEAVDWEHSSVFEKSVIIGNIHENPDLIK